MAKSRKGSGGGIVGKSAAAAAAARSRAARSQGGTGPAEPLNSFQKSHLKLVNELASKGRTWPGNKQYVDLLRAKNKVYRRSKGT
jgi:hypothetical protein